TGEPDGGVDVCGFDRQAALQPLVKPRDRLVRDAGIVRGARDRELVAAGADLHVGELLDAHQIAVVVAIQHGKQPIVVECHAANVGRAAGAGGGIAHAAASKDGTISPARLTAWASVSRTSTIFPTSAVGASAWTDCSHGLLPNTWP